MDAGSRVKCSSTVLLTGGAEKAPSCWEVGSASRRAECVAQCLHVEAIDIEPSWLHDAPSVTSAAPPRSKACPEFPARTARVERRWWAPVRGPLYVGLDLPG